MMRAFKREEPEYELDETVEWCDDCHTPTVHYTPSGGVAVCGQCGYNPIFDQFSDDDEEPEPSTGGKILFFRRS